MFPYDAIPCEPDVSVRHPAAVRLPPDHQVLTTASRSVGRTSDSSRTEPVRQIAASRLVGPLRAAGHDRPTETANGSVMSGWHPGTGWRRSDDTSVSGASAPRLLMRGLDPPLFLLHSTYLGLSTRQGRATPSSPAVPQEPQAGRGEVHRHRGAPAAPRQAAGSCRGDRRSLAWTLGPRSRCVRGTQEGTRPMATHPQRAPPTVVLANSDLTWSGLLMEDLQDVGENQTSRWLHRWSR
jgi:hypothetical protein